MSSSSPSMRGKVVAIVQARMGSTRLPGKSLLPLSGKPAIERLLSRLARAHQVDEIWVATSDKGENDPLVALVERLGFPVFRGDENDVLSRFAIVAQKSGADAIVRVTGDCPLIDPVVVDSIIQHFRASDADFVSNTLTRSFPDGLDVEVFTVAALNEAASKAQEPFLRQHVTPYIHGRLKDRFPAGDFKREQVIWPQNYGHLRWTLDEAADADFLSRVFSDLPEQCGWLDVIAYCTANPALFFFNRSIPHNQGTTLDLQESRGRYQESNRLFERARQTIPLASQTFSKSYQQWVKGSTPLFLDRGQGGWVWDVDGNRYADFVLGLLPVILGYADPDVNAAMMDQMERGATFSLPTRLEMELAERLVRLIPCAEKVRFGKNGSDATTAAIRLARAKTGRDKVVVGGYHGWHDWYIGSTARRLGVPGVVQDLTENFAFNDADQLEDILKGQPDAFAAVILEPAGTVNPAPGFLERVRALTEQYGVVLIFDEIVTGFRMDLGGAQAVYGVTPDLACVGKAMGNGMPIAAVVGRSDIMDLMEDIFFSGTFGGEAISLAAAIATIDKLESQNVIPRLKTVGANFATMANGIFRDVGMDNYVQVTDIDWWPRLSFSEAPISGGLLTSLMRQEFVANGLLLGASFNLCLAQEDHGFQKHVEQGMRAAMEQVKEHMALPDPSMALKGDMIQPTFSVRK